MNKKILIGSIGAMIIIVLAAFSAVVNAQTTKETIKDMISEVTKKSKNERIQSLQQMKNFVLKEGWYPGWFLGILADFALWLALALFAIWFLYIPNLSIP